MGAVDVSITADDLLQCGWEEVVQNAPEKDCMLYSTTFFRKAKEAATAGEPRKEAALVTLGVITSLDLDVDTGSGTTRSQATLMYSRAIGLEDLREHHFEALQAFVHSVTDPELRAQIAHALWIAKRDYRMAELAIDSYVESACVGRDPEQWVPYYERLARAAGVGATLGKKSRGFARAMDAVKSALQEAPVPDRSFLSARLMTILLEHGEGDSERFSRLAEDSATCAEQEGDWDRAREYWQVAARWHGRAGKETEKRDAMLRAAETWVREAESAVSGDKPSYLTAAALLEKAIAAFRRIGGAQARVEQVHRLLLQYQAMARSEMQRISSSVDVSGIARSAVALVKGKSFREALFELALMGRSPSKAELRKEVEESAEQFPAQYLLSAVVVNEQGRVIARKPSLLADDPRTREAAIEAEMFSQARFHWHLHAASVIEPARRQILREHWVRLTDVLDVIAPSPFIPEGRELIYGKGLHAGLTGDFMVAVNLLVPQVEHSIRYILAQHGVITSGFDAEGIQEEFDLNRLLYIPELEKILDEDTVFDLRGLLVERFGSNLRNRVAHGLIDSKGFFSSVMSYFWWITLRLCCVPLIIREANQVSGLEANPAKST